MSFKIESIKVGCVKQNTASSFGSEFIALKTAVELIEGMRHKLHMFGIPIDGPCSVFCDNEATVESSTIPKSTLKKKHNAIAYHNVRESVAMGVIQIGHIHSSVKLADMLTKPLTRGKINEFCEQFLY